MNLMKNGQMDRDNEIFNIISLSLHITIPAEKCSCRSTKKAKMFKAKRLIEKVGISYLKQVSWSPQQTIPDHRLYLSIQL